MIAHHSIHIFIAMSICIGAMELPANCYRGYLPVLQSAMGAMDHTAMAIEHI